MTIDVDKTLSHFIEQKIRSGEFKTPAEVVFAALSRWADEEEMDFAPGELDALLLPALDQLDRGDIISADDVDRHVEEHIRRATAGQREA